MMEHNTEKLLSAIGDVDAAYLEEALDLMPRTRAGNGLPASLNYPPRAWRCWSYWAYP